MQLTSYKPKYIEKVVKTPEGVFLARFVVTSEGHSFKLRLCELIPIEKTEAKESALLLESPKSQADFFEYIIEPSSIVSPYSNFEFFFSQPTRAPSFS